MNEPNGITRDDLVPDPQVAKEFHVTPVTMYRWTQDPNFGFPPVIKIRTRNYRSRRALEEFKARMIAQGIRNRAEVA